MAGIGDIIKNPNASTEEIKAAFLGQMQKTEQYREQGGNVTYGIICTDLHSGLTGMTREEAISGAIRMNLEAILKGGGGDCLYIPMAFIDSSKSSRG